MAQETEAERLLKKLLAPPQIQTEAGFTAKLLIPPGQLYDPLLMRPQGGVVWLNDDGSEENGKGSRLLSLSKQRKIAVLVGGWVHCGNFGAGGHVYVVYTTQKDEYATALRLIAPLLDFLWPIRYGLTSPSSH
jgi:hypothetical protein